MTRAALPLLLLGAASLAGCARETPQNLALAAPPAASAAPEPAPASPSQPRVTLGMRGRPAVVTPTPAPPPPPSAPLTAPRPGEVYSSPPPTAVQRDQAALIAACRQQAERIILERDRSQLLREDEQAARLGASTSAYDTQYTSDRLGRVFARDRMVEDCVDRNRPLPPRTPLQ